MKNQSGIEALIQGAQIIVGIISLKLMYDSVRGNNEQMKVLLDIQNRLRSLKE